MKTHAIYLYIYYIMSKKFDAGLFTHASHSNPATSDPERSSINRNASEITEDETLEKKDRSYSITE